MPFPWDEDNPQVRNRIMDNLAVLLPDVVASGRRRDQPSMDLVGDWHRRMLDASPLWNRLSPAASEAAAHKVASSRHTGWPSTKSRQVRPGRVRSQMSPFERRTGERVTALDSLIPPKAPQERREHQVIALCAWAHGECIRIHHSPTATAVWREPCFCGLGPATACPSSSTFAHGRVAQPDTRVHRELP